MSTYDKNAVDISDKIEFGDNRFLNDREKVTIQAIVEYQAFTLRLAPYTIKKALMAEFGLRDMCELRASHYDDVVMYLCDFAGVN